MAASLAGSRLTGFSPPAVPGRRSGRAAGPAPRTGLSRTRVAISSGTPSGPEGCAERAVSGLKFPLRGRAWACSGPAAAGSGQQRRETGSGKAGTGQASAPSRTRPCLTSAAVAEPRLRTATAASPSEAESAAWRIDLAFQRIGRWVAGSGWPDLAARVGRKAPLVLL